MLPLLNGVPNKEGEALVKFLYSIRSGLVDLGSGIWVAGGAVRTILTGEEVSDVDLFFRDQAARDDMIRNLDSKGAKQLFVCPKRELFTYDFRGFKVQLICKRYYETKRQLLDSFDFTICRFGFSLSDVHQLDGHPRVADFVSLAFSDYYDLQRRHLRVHKIEYPVATLNRIQKYMKKGFKPWHQEDFYVQLVMAIKAAPIDEEHMALYID